MEEAGKSSEKLGGLHRELHEALRSISSESPVAGAALSISFLGAVGAIFTAVELFREAKEAIKEYETELDNGRSATALAATQFSLWIPWPNNMGYEHSKLWRPYRNGFDAPISSDTKSGGKKWMEFAAIGRSDKAL